MQHDFWEQKLQSGTVTYLLIGEEACPDTKRQHWQFFCYTKSDHKDTIAFRKKFGGRHIEAAKGSIEENQAYCKKGGLFQELGSPPRENQGARTDLNVIKQRIDSGASRMEIADEFFGKFCQYHKAFDMYRSLKAKPRDFQTFNTIVWGITGSGKTTLCVRNNAQPVFYDGTFIHGYNGEQDAVYFDEFDYTKMPRELFLQLTDRHPMIVNVKNGTVNWRPRKIYFTSNFDPSFWYPDATTGLQDAAVTRRVSEPMGRIIKLTEVLKYTGHADNPVVIDLEEDGKDYKIKIEEASKPAVVASIQDSGPGQFKITLKGRSVSTTSTVLLDEEDNKSPAKRDRKRIEPSAPKKRKRSPEPSQETCEATETDMDIDEDEDDDEDDDDETISDEDFEHPDGCKCTDCQPE